MPIFPLIKQEKQAPQKYIYLEKDTILPEQYEKLKKEKEKEQENHIIIELFDKE